MRRIILNKLAQALCAVVLVAVLISVAEEIVAVDTARSLAGLKASEEEVAVLRRQLGQDRPLFVRIADRAGGAFIGDLGTSTAFRQPVLALLAPALAKTLLLIAPAWLVGTVLGWGLGLGVALLRSRAAQRTLLVGAALALLPPLALAALLHYILRFELGWPVPDRLAAMAVLTLIPLAMTALTTSSVYRDFLSGDRYAALRGLGWPSRRVLLREGAAEAAVAVVSNLSYVFLYLLVGSVFVEIIFQLTGLGTLLLDAAERVDYPLLFGASLAVVAVFLVLDTLTDATLLKAQPRLREQMKVATA